ncbi:Cystathionine gamma-synthase 1, chloroplastic [Capsicum baccatum]|uniref:Cystathionine gamma-synthase 1, chloroplastic n=1 Tax=Capsicum baccatum TaxID=33114 RepID=A0A2G2VHB9_CAPBA|nr:Cystathionine gamma-synthase 1, chloroplastic [Capsicum baccatum]
MKRPTISSKDIASPSQTVASEDTSNLLIGVHSLMNVERPTISGNDTASPAETVAGKDSSNPLTADTLPKSVGRILPASFKTTGTQTTDEGSFSKMRKGFSLGKKKNEERNIEKIVVDSIKKLLAEQMPKEIAVNPEPPEPRSRIPREKIRSSRTGTRLGLSAGDSNEYDRDYNSVMDQFTQDLNANDDSEMNFDSEALHNLDTFPPNFVRQLSVKARRNCSNLGLAQVVAALWSNIYASPDFIPTAKTVDATAAIAPLDITTGDEEMAVVENPPCAARPVQIEDLTGEKISALEGAESTLLMASGMCASTVMLLALVPAGGHIVTTTDCYRKTRIFFETILPKMGITATVIDPADIGALESVLSQKKVTLFFTESPTNPCLRCVDIELVSKLCHEKGVLVCIDGGRSQHPLTKRKMETEIQMHDDATTVAATSIAMTRRANAPQHMAPAEKPEKFAGIDFKRWQQKMFFYLTTLCLQKFTSEDAPEGTSNKERFIIVEAWKHSDFLCRNYILSGL